MLNGLPTGGTEVLRWFADIPPDLAAYIDPRPLLELLMRLAVDFRAHLLLALASYSNSLVKMSVLYVGRFASKILFAEMFILFLIFGCSLLFFYYLYRSRGLPPGPWGLPILGFLPWLDPDRPQVTLFELSQDYGPIFSLRLGEVTGVVLSHPVLVKEALSKEVFTGRAPLWLTHGLMNNNGLIAVEGEKWREQRKFVVGCLKTLGAVKIGSKRHLMGGRILDGIKETIKLLKKQERDCGAEGFDPHKILTHTIGNVVNSFVFGRTFAKEDETWLWLQSLAEEGVKLVGVAGILNFIPILRFLPKYNRILNYVKSGQIRTHAVYREFASASRPGGDSLLAMYLEAIQSHRGKYFSEEQMNHVLADMFGAGLDTSLATLRWFLLFVALHPEVQTRCQEEIDSVLGRRREANLDDINLCHYTEATLLEAMRIRPVVPLGIPHGCLEETTLSGYRIPAGTMVIVNQWALHHDPTHWERPEDFVPERFIDEDGSIKKSSYFNPFQNGEELARMPLSRTLSPSSASSPSSQSGMPVMPSLVPLVSPTPLPVTAYVVPAQVSGSAQVRNWLGCSSSRTLSPSCASSPSSQSGMPVVRSLVPLGSRSPQPVTD